MIPVGKKLAVDEQMIPFMVRNRPKQHLPEKPRKLGYKVLLAGSNGVPHNCEIYTGRVAQPPELADVGASGNTLFIDNFFQSVCHMLMQA